MFSRIYYLIIKELLASWRDPKARVILIVPPIIQVVIFSFAMTQEVKNAKLAVLNLDSGLEGDALIKSFTQTPSFRKIIQLSHQGEIVDILDKQKASVVLVIPADFSSELLDQKSAATIQIILDGRRANAAPILNGYMQRIIQKNQVNRLQENGIDIQSRAGVNVVTRHWFNPNLQPRDSFVPGLICLLTAVVGLIMSGLSIAREREVGTFEQLLVSPLTPLEILIGKAATVVFLTTLTAGMLVLIIIFGFGITLKGSLLLLFVSMEAFLLSVVGIGLFVSSLSTTQQQAILGCILFLPPAIMLSGFATPLENMPVWLQTITLIDPIRWFLVIIKGLFLRGMSADVVWENIQPLLIISFVTLSAAVFMFKKRME